MENFSSLSASARWILVAGLVGAGAVASAAPTNPGPSSSGSVQGQHKVSPYHPESQPKHAQDHVRAVWGVDHLKVTSTASGNLIRFSYRVTDSARARTLGDKSSKPVLIGQSSHAVLHVPVMDKVGELRQGGELAEGKDYWMVFSNKGNLVKPGERVSVVIGVFRADGLLLE